MSNKQKIIKYVEDFFNENSYAPTYQEIGDHLGGVHRQNVARIIWKSKDELKKYYPRVFKDR